MRITNWIRYLWNGCLELLKNIFSLRDSALKEASQGGVLLATDFKLADDIDSFFKTTFCPEGDPTLLCQIMTEETSDKGSRIHSYTQLYHFLLNSLKNEPLNIFELGIGTVNKEFKSSMFSHQLHPSGYRPGASLRGWKRFFVNSEIYGADIDEKCLFQEERLHTYQVDQINPDSIQNMWSKISKDKMMDLIIDDGLHTFEANCCFFENSIKHLKPGHFYIIEDVKLSTKNVLKFYKFFKEKDVKMVVIQMPHKKKMGVFSKMTNLTGLYNGIIVIRK